MSSFTEMSIVSKSTERDIHPMPTHGTTQEAQTAASSHGPKLPETKLNQTRSNSKAARRQPTNLEDVAFLDIRDVCAMARMSASWIHDEVRGRRFPQPLRFGMRCTRWRSADVRDWLIARSTAAEADTETGALLTARAKKASDAAQAKRRATARLVGKPA